MNGCKNPYILLARSIKRPLGSNLLRQDSLVAKFISSEANINKEKVISGFYQANSTTSSHAGLKIQGILVRSNLIRYATAICSDCADENFQRFTKDITLFGNCPYHFKKYLFNCPACGVELKWKTMCDFRCKCGMTLKSPDCAFEDVEHELKILKIFQNKDQSSFENLVHILDKLDFAYSSKTRTAENTRLIKVALSILTEDRDGVTQYLHTLELEHPEVPRNFLCGKILTIKTDFVEDACREFKASPTTERPQRKSNFGSKFHLTQEQLKSLLGIKNYQWLFINKALHRSESEGKQTKYNLENIARSFTLIDKALKQRLVQKERENAAFISAEFAAEILRIPPYVIPELLRTGLLEGRKGKNGKLEIRKPSIREFNLSYSCLQQIANEFSSGTQSIQATMRKCGITPFYHGKNLVIVKRSDAIKIRKAHFAKITKSNSRWHKYSASLKRTNENTDDYTSALEAEQQLGISKCLIYQLIRAGIFTKVLKGKNGKYLLQKNEVNNFDKNYMLPREISKASSTPINIIERKLRTLGIYPVSGRTVDGFSLHLFRRSEISPNVIERLALLELSETREKRVQAATKPNDTSQYVKLESILSEYKISSKDFTRLFLKSHYITTITLREEKLINQENIKKLRSVLDNYYTCATADKYFNRHGYTRNLLRNRKISPTINSLTLQFDVTLIERGIIHRYNPK